jgi:hypothetical protein
LKDEGNTKKGSPTYQLARMHILGDIEKAEVQLNGEWLAGFKRRKHR